MKKTFIVLGFLFVCSFIEAQTSTIKDYGSTIEFCHQSGDTTGIIKNNIIGNIEAVRNAVKLGSENPFFVRYEDYGYGSVDSLRNYLLQVVSENYRIIISDAVLENSDTVWHIINANGILDTTCYRLIIGETYIGEYIPY